MSAASQPPGLVADVGGTHVRFGRVRGAGRVDRFRTYKCADHASPTAAARAYLDGIGGEPPRRAAFAIAGPVENGRVRMTNHVWTFSRETLRRELDLDRVVLLNDFAALALAVPALGAKDLVQLKEGSRDADAPFAVIGPGTGLGVAALLRVGGSWYPLTTEGGHRDLAAQSEREWRIVRHLAERFEHVSVERALSGPGLVNLYQAVCSLAAEDPQSLTPAAVVAGARARSSAACVEAVSLFSGWLGAVAGDLALTFGARGGVYLGGGMLRKMQDAFDVDRFRERFLAKGRFREYLRPIAVHAIVHPQATLLGAARALELDR